MRNKAFTLSELLIALAILGLIAAFTIPKVLHSTNDTVRSSIFKEILAVVERVGYEAYSLGEANYNRFDWYNEHIAAVKVCDTQSTTQNCTTSSMVGNTTQRALVFHNGAVLYGMSTLGCCQTFSQGDGWYLDYNGPKPPNTIGEDVLYLRAVQFNPDSSFSLTYSGRDVLYRPNDTASETLYNNLW